MSLLWKQTRNINYDGKNLEGAQQHFLINEKHDGWKSKRWHFCVELHSAGADSPWSVDISTFFASRCVYSRHCVRGWIRTLLQLSLSRLWSRLSWRVCDRRATQTWATVLLLGSFLTTCKQAQVKRGAFLTMTPVHSVTPCFTSWSWRWSGRQVFLGNAHTRSQSRSVAEGNPSGPAAAGSSAPAAGQTPWAGPQAGNASLKGKFDSLSDLQSSSPSTTTAHVVTTTQNQKQLFENVAYYLWFVSHSRPIQRALSWVLHEKSFLFQEGVGSLVKRSEIIEQQPLSPSVHMS